MSRNKNKNAWWNATPLAAREDSVKNLAEASDSQKPKKEVRDYRDVWKLPFNNDCDCYIFDSKGTMVFTFEDFSDRYLSKNFVALLNDDPSAAKMSNLEVKDGCDLYQNGKLIGYFRGWGHLIGTGGLHLPPKRAAEIQDEFIKWCLTKLQ